MQLIVQSGPDAGRSFGLDQPVMVVGRQIGTNITINDAQVSRRHAQFDTRGGNVSVTDLGSINGTFVNGRRIGVQPEPLRSGDSVRIGNSTILFSPTATTSPAFAPATFGGYGSAFDMPAVASSAPTQFVPVQTPAQTSPYAQPPEAIFASPTPAKKPAKEKTPKAPKPDKKRGNPAEAIVGFIALLVLAAIIVGGLIVAGIINLPGTEAAAPATPVPAATVAQGQNGNNPAPPVPTTVPQNNATPAATSAPKATSAPAATSAPKATTAPTGTKSATTPGTKGTQQVNGLGATFTVPKDWKFSIKDDADATYVQANPPSGSDAFVRVIRLGTDPTTDDVQTRLQGVMKVFEDNYKSYKAGDIVTTPSGATVQLDVTDKQNMNIRVYIYSTQNADNVPYIVLMEARKERYTGFAGIFEDVIASLAFTGN